MVCLSVPTGWGTFRLCAREGALSHLVLPGCDGPEGEEGESPCLALARRELLEYLAGDRREFDLPLDLRGTPFQ